MLSSYYTLEELQNTKLYELPNYLYTRILRDIRETIGVMNKRLIHILNHHMVTDLDEYCNVYQYIHVI